MVRETIQTVNHEGQAVELTLRTAFRDASFAEDDYTRALRVQVRPRSGVKKLFKTFLDEEGIQPWHVGRAFLPFAGIWPCFDIRPATREHAERIGEFCLKHPYDVSFEYGVVDARTRFTPEQRLMIIEHECPAIP